MEKRKINRDSYILEIKKIEEEYEKLIEDINLSYPFPTNFKEEKEIFQLAIRKRKKYNPKFKFDLPEIEEEKINNLEKFKINTSNDLYGFKKLYKEKIKNKVLQLRYHKNWGKPESVEYIIKYYGKPSQQLLKKAQTICEKFQREKVKFKTLTPEIAGERLKKEVLKLTEKNAEIKFENINSKINITPHLNLIRINPNERFTSLDIKRLKVHEIGVHYMRYFNGLNTDIKILQTGTANYIETEEGLATYCEELKGYSSKAQIYVYAGRVIATHYALEKSFYDVFKILKSYGFSNKIAFTITFRAKRNMEDTSKPGGFTKDYVYLKGFFKIQNFAKNNDIKDLFIGKIKIEDIKYLRKFIDENKKNIVTIFDKKFNKKQ